MKDASTVYAAGCALWRPEAHGHGVELALVHRPKWDDWSLPKGKLKRGETAETAARREVLEETGFRCVLGNSLPTVHYVDAYGRPKQVRYWAAQATEGRFTPNEEVDALEWLSPFLAVQRLSHERDTELVRILLAVLEAEGVAL
ncbi:NUDIX hydrolase [Streptomyces melanogenes]|uniref:NUDIX hydrolase n=1 Tax=Streptomyces melanogenes TaxID=67326 RepID=UPI00167F1D14|nr:NUDIX hydrolase [Streptomyces melanogenes]GGP94435.1 DNA mismatch repair protein MutT [Streptomyces melanogenes]